MRGTFLQIIGALGALLMAATSWSATLTWTLNDVTFDDGATAAGTFDFDSATNTYSNIAITVTDFTNSQVYGPLGSDPYAYTNPIVHGFSSDTALIFIEEFSSSIPGSDCIGNCQRMMLIEFAAPLTSLGGTVAIDPNVVSFESLDNGFENDAHNIIEGTLSATTVPVPAAVWLFGSALAGLGWFRRKQMV